MAREEANVSHDGPVVLLGIGGKSLRMPPAVAKELARWLWHHAGRAEEIEKRELIVRDAAILLRTGAPVGILHDPHLIHEAAREAAWNSDLRRALPGGVRSTEAAGVPGVRNDSP